MMQRFLRTGLILSTSLALAACTSARFGGPGPVPAAAPRAAALYNEPVTSLEPGFAVPSGEVTSEPLAPPPGSAGLADWDDDLDSAGGTGLADIPATPPFQSAAVQPPPAAPAAVTRTSVVGSWSAREAGGSTCRVTLSSSPALDLYKASTSGCKNADLGRITAWDLRGNEVYLYQQGGAVAARLRAASGQMDGVLAKSGAPLAMSR